MSGTETRRWPRSRTRKFRQAAFTYLHIGLLYEFGVYVLWREGHFPTARGPALLWLLLGAAIMLFVFWGLLRWQNVHFARVIWALHSLRLPTLIDNAFFPSPQATVTPDLFLAAIPLVLINLWMLARAAWDI